MNTYLVTIYGKGGHGAEPHEAIDTTVISSEFVRKTTKYKNIEILPPKENTVTFKSNEKENVKAPVLLDSKENQVIAKETKTLPNTGTSSQSTAIIGLISAAVALRLRKKA